MTNPFMELVSKAIPFSYKNLFKYLSYKSAKKKLYKTIKNGSPNLGTLWNFATFIQYADVIYFYNNKKDSYVYASTEYNPGTSGFKINTEDTCITIKLWSETQTVGIDIANKKGSMTKTNYTFVNQQWTSEPDEYDQIYIDFIISIINKSMIYLIDYCIDKKLEIMDDRPDAYLVL